MVNIGLNIVEILQLTTLFWGGGGGGGKEWWKSFSEVFVPTICNSLSEVDELIDMDVSSVMFLIFVRINAN